MSARRPTGALLLGLLGQLEQTGGAYRQDGAVYAEEEDYEESPLEELPPRDF